MDRPGGAVAGGSTHQRRKSEAASRVGANMSLLSLFFLNMLRTLAFSTLKNPQPSQTSASLRPLALQLLSATDTVSLINCGIKSLQPNEHAEDKLPRGAAEMQGVRVQHDEGGQRTTEIPHHVIHPTVTTLVPSSWATQMQE